MRDAELFTSPVTAHGECPFWDATTNRLLCADVLAGAIVAIDESGRASRHTVPSRAVSVIRRRSSGGYALATEHGVVGADERFSNFEPIADLVDDPAVRTNDGGCDPLGGFVVGTMAYDERPGAGRVLRIGVDHAVTEILASVSISNGVQWSADGTRVYYIDTPTRRVDVFDVDPDTGAWSERRPHIAVEDTPGYPDGMAIDEEDGLWVALWGAGAVNHYDVVGQLVETINVPGITQSSSCTFGGAGRTTLYITTSRQGVAGQSEAAAGAIFAIDTPVHGAYQADYRG
ncbi:MAG: SMP-30/gluconolactonase/LRE family protein [Actinomycetota bacterium]